MAQTTRQAAPTLKGSVLVQHRVGSLMSGSGKCRCWAKSGHGGNSACIFGLLDSLQPWLAILTSSKNCIFSSTSLSLQELAARILDAERYELLVSSVLLSIAPSAMVAPCQRRSRAAADT